MDAGALIDRERYSDVVARLARSQKSMHRAPGWSRWVNRPLGRRMAAVSYLRGLTPNQVTAISAAFTFSALAVVMLVRPSWPMAIGVSIALILGYAFDAADGQLARLRGGGSPVGEWLDHVTDSFKNVTVHAAVLVSWYRFADLDSEAWLAVPLCFALVSTVIFFAMTLTDQLRRARGAAAKGEGKSTMGERAPLMPSLVLLPTDYGFLCLCFSLLAWTDVFAPLYTLLAVANALFLAAGLRRWFSEVSTF